MYLFKYLLFVGVFALLTTNASAQRAKDGSYTASGTDEVLNTYTHLTNDAAQGVNSITVSNNAMNGGVFTSNLAAGDLILIIQMQGAGVDIADVIGCCGGSSASSFSDFWNWWLIYDLFGAVTQYRQSGKFEMAEVAGVTGSNIIQLQCNTINAYVAGHHTQIVRVPRFDNLTVSGGANSIVPLQWDGNSGGVVAIEVDGTLNIAAGSSISATGYGFRGGELDPDGLPGNTSNPTEKRFPGTNDSFQGSEKGESIYGYHAEYDGRNTRYGIGAAANGGGGGGYQNCGGGGGSNISPTLTGFTGKGVPQGAAGPWNLETPAIGGTSSPGGGRGGYAYSNSNQNELTTGPENASWGGDSRKNNGGLGGHPLAYDATRIFFGGGGGAGDQDSDEGGASGNGGGIVYIKSFGTITGSGTIEANGADGQNTNPTNAATGFFTPRRGNDGAGGDGSNYGGGGGAAGDDGGGGGNGADGYVILTWVATVNTPTIGTITQPDCTTPTGSVVLNDLPNTGAWVLTQSPGAIETIGTGSSTTISGLSEGTYTYTVKKAGLTAEYFNNTTLSGQPVITRTDATVDFDWGNNSPDNLINNDVFSVRWSGEVQPLVSDNYIFRTNSDDGVRLWVNGALVINNWNDYPATYNYSASIALVAGQKYTIILEYYENAGQAIAQLEWNRSSNTTYQTIPQSQLFPNSTSNLIASNNVVINAQPLNNWTGALNKNWNNAANWTCGIPTNTSNVVIPSGLINYPEIYDGDNEGLSNNIEFEAGTSLIIYNNYINISGELLLNGFIDLDGEAQLIQATGSIFNTTSTGYIERDQQGVGNKYRYNDWSSPVSSNAITQTYTVGGVLKDGTDASNPINIDFVGGYDGDNTTTPIQIANYWIYKYANDAHDNYSKWNQVGSTGSLKAGEGYLMKGTGNPGAKDQNYVFVGKPNNGDITLTVAGTNDYLIGNPYPSAIDADQFILDNRNSIEGGTIYFWEHYGGNSHNLKDYKAGYGYYNFSGGVRASSHPINNPNSGPGSKTPGRYIAVGQGFFVQGDADGGDIVFKNSQRAFVTEDNPSNSIFLKAIQTKKGETSNNKNIDNRLKIRLLLESNSEERRELLLTIDERASDAIDWGFDAPIYEEFAEDMYWPIENGKYIIQGTNNFTNDKEVPLAIKSVGELIEIKIDTLENVDESTDIYIKDNVTGILHDIKNQNFQITLPKGEYLNRFSIVFETQSTLGFEDEVLENKIQVFMDNANSELHIKNTTNSEIQSAVLYNILGQTVKFWSGNNLLNKTTALPVNVNAGAYIVKLATSQGAISKKIVIQ